MLAAKATGTFAPQPIANVCLARMKSGVVVQHQTVQFQLAACQTLSILVRIVVEAMKV
tara:strand:+ start:3900 stop:4073 length:174 start_codon:yes stop_codon:yes gene_type:complete